ncbi:39S ribosomal protein L55, mitochondrial-like [Salvelinus fontinalis]|uniref:39S ribosomal protein L55, mitochondrial-like n=1 Tax=Salvelinus fontinalis TaxID=8038 RepID=UPI0024854FF4|nr:39S ribosomal protein L55, mitochondrial-like [Salvelinus fontinalis]
MALLKVWTSTRLLNRCLPEVVAKRHLFPASTLHTATTQHNSNKTSIVRCSRQNYERMYPVLLIEPDGSTINIRHKKPKRILMMPVDISTLSEEGRKRRMRKQDPKKGAVKQRTVEFKDDFKADDYSKFWKT